MARKLTMYYFETHIGCGLHSANNLQQAQNEIRQEVGYAVFKSVHKATEEEISWVKAMNGYVPSLEV